MIAGVAVVLIVSAYLVLGGESQSGSGGEQETDSTTSAPTAPTPLEAQNHGGYTPPLPIRMRAGAQPRKPGEPATGSIEEQFGSEAVDIDWANGKKVMIQSVVAELIEMGTGSADIAELECRTQSCLLRLTGDDEADLIKLVDALQDERGFLGKAESMMLSRDGGDLKVYLRFPVAQP